MAHQIVPHFCNDDGVASIRVGAREFMCIGARAPFDHPHVFLDMGGDSEAVCPYCSTRFVYDASLGAGDADPANCVVVAEAAE
ncbi:MAG: zinc-finger domain-containing protein [Hyphomicrobiales bacterium]|nr:MAG: zinc-finger domain-containing protein [Hyphomicrobiales bacterium]